MRPYFSLLLTTLLFTGCIFPRSTLEKPGNLLVEKQAKKTEPKLRFQLSYDYPDIQASFEEGTVQTWQERYGTPTLSGQLEYSLWGDCQEIIIGGPLFASGILGFGADLALFRYRQQTVDNMLFLFAILPVIQHSEMAAEPQQFEQVGEVDWGEWRSEKKERLDAVENRTLNFVSASGQVLYQLETDRRGEAFADIREIYGRLFKGPEKAVAILDMISGERIPLPKTLSEEMVLETAKQKGEEASLNSSSTESVDDE